MSSLVLAVKATFRLNLVDEAADASTCTNGMHTRVFWPVCRVELGHSGKSRCEAHAQSMGASRQLYDVSSVMPGRVDLVLTGKRNCFAMSDPVFQSFHDETRQIGACDFGLGKASIARRRPRSGCRLVRQRDRLDQRVRRG